MNRSARRPSLTLSADGNRGRCPAGAALYSATPNMAITHPPSLLPPSHAFAHGQPIRWTRATRSLGVLLAVRLSSTMAKPSIAHPRGCEAAASRLWAVSVRAQRPKRLLRASRACLPTHEDRGDGRLVQTLRGGRRRRPLGVVQIDDEIRRRRGTGTARLAVAQRNAALR
jgi:hypothetical protein